LEIDILSLFPEYFEGPFTVSMLKRAQEAHLLEIRHADIRNFAENKHGRVDDRPFGGGPGMVLCAGPVVRAIRSVRKPTSHVIYLTPQGKTLTAAKAQELAKKEHLILLCGHYEGVDERALKEVDEEISIGDYVLTSGCAAAVVLVDALARFIPGVIGHPDATQEDSFQEGIFDSPHYTRPEVFEGAEVPAVLLGGNHAEIRKWRKAQAIDKTGRVRPDLLKNVGECCEQITSYRKS
jgi:tRNA (guanine37-N1)-methyltransferase